MSRDSPERVFPAGSIISRQSRNQRRKQLNRTLIRIDDQTGCIRRDPACHQAAPISVIAQTATMATPKATMLSPVKITSTETAVAAVICDDNPDGPRKYRRRPQSVE